MAQFQVEFFRQNLGDVCEEHVEHFHQDIEAIERDTRDVGMLL
jgi:hypothetical protein